jgi:hypothetical protein
MNAEHRQSREAHQQLLHGLRLKELSALAFLEQE